MIIKKNLVALAFAIAPTLSFSQATEAPSRDPKWMPRFGDPLICGPIAPPGHQIEMYCNAHKGPNLHPQTVRGLHAFMTESYQGFGYILEWGATNVNHFINNDKPKSEALKKILGNIRMAAQQGKITQAFYLAANVQFALLMTDKSVKNRELLAELRSMDWTNTVGIAELFKDVIHNMGKSKTELLGFIERLFLATGKGGHCVVYYDPAFIAYRTFNRCLLRDNPVTLSVISTQGKKAHSGIHPEVLDFFYHDIIHSLLTMKMFANFPQYFNVLKDIYHKKAGKAKIDEAGTFLLIHEFTTNLGEDKYRVDVPLIPIAGKSGSALDFAEVVNGAYGYIQKSSTLNPTSGAIASLLNSKNGSDLFEVSSFDSLSASEDIFRARITVSNRQSESGSVVVRLMPLGELVELGIILECRGVEKDKASLPPIGVPIPLLLNDSRAGIFSFYKDDMTSTVSGLPSLRFDADAPREEELRRCLIELLEQFYKGNAHLVRPTYDSRNSYISSPLVLNSYHYL